MKMHVQVFKANNEMLHNLYWGEGLSLKQIAKKLGCSKVTVDYWMMKYRIPRRTGDWFQPKIKMEREELYNLYWEKGLSLTEIAKKLGCTPRAILFQMKKMNIPRRKRVEAIYKSPLIKKPNLEPSPTLAYVIGVLLGDGSVYISTEKRRYRIDLGVTSKEFCLCFGRALMKIGLNPTYYTRKPKLENAKEIYGVVATSIVFSKWYKELNLKDIEKIVSTNSECKKSFVKGFYESEGSVKSFAIRMANSNPDLLLLAKKLIETFNFRAKIKGPYKPGKNQKSFKYQLLILGGRQKIRPFLDTFDPCTKRLDAEVITA